MEEPPAKRSPSVPQLSKTPSWVLLGFILGALFVLALPRREPQPRTVVVTREVQPRRPTEPPQITRIEAVFNAWSQYAVWDNDTTQVAMWNSEVGDFAEFYEVRRIDGNTYFRSLTRLTNPVIRHGKKPPPECPLLFTETEEQYQEWRKEGRFERPAENLGRPLSITRETPSVPPPSAPTMAPVTPPPPPKFEKGQDLVPAK